MNPGVEKGYPLDFLTVVRHVATKLEEARPDGRAIPLSELTSDYHPMPADLSRVKQAHGFDDDREAVRFLVERAIEALGERQVGKVDDGYKLLVGFDQLRYERRKLHQIRNDHARLRDPFNPMSGRFVELRRKTGKDNMEALRASMKAFGWLPQLPAIKDERGVVLVGNRRMAVAKELGIEPVVTPLHLGSGDEADAARFKLAIASNEGGKPLTPEERHSIAEYLYVDKDWSMERIAEALNVTAKTVSTDLNNLKDFKKTERRGRPRKEEQRQLEEEVEPLVAEGKSLKAIAQELGKKESTINRTVDRVRGRLEERAIQENMECTCPECGHKHQRRRDDSSDS